jgi:stage II sporulation protein M
LGFTVIGFPLILALIFLRGYILGFTVGFFIGGLGARGLLLSILSILPQNMIIIPSIISIAVAGTIFSATVLKNRKVLYAEGYSHLIISYVLYNLMFSVLLVFSSLIEGYISPTFIKLLTHYI